MVLVYDDGGSIPDFMVSDVIHLVVAGILVFGLSLELFWRLSLGFVSSLSVLLSQCRSAYIPFKWGRDGG